MKWISLSSWLHIPCAALRTWLRDIKEEGFPEIPGPKHCVFQLWTTDYWKGMSRVISYTNLFTLNWPQGSRGKEKPAIPSLWWLSYWEVCQQIIRHSEVKMSNGQQIALLNFHCNLQPPWSAGYIPVSVMQGNSRSQQARPAAFTSCLHIHFRAQPSHRRHAIIPRQSISMSNISWRTTVIS